MAAGAGSHGRRFGTGRVCLDLVATAPGADGGYEQLDCAARLAGWLVSAGLVPKGRRLRWTTAGRCAFGSYGPASTS
ncbi:ABATE domain-containing protein [Streptomyces sp. M10(2022)]